MMYSLLHTLAYTYDLDPQIVSVCREVYKFNKSASIPSSSKNLFQKSIQKTLISGFLETFQYSETYMLYFCWVFSVGFHVFFPKNSPMGFAKAPGGV